MPKSAKISIRKIIIVSEKRMAYGNEWRSGEGWRNVS